ncbi:MAG: alpha-glycosidase, partial [Paenibacillaceae bacterium]
RLAYERFDAEGHFIIMMNVSKRMRKITVTLPAGLWQDVTSGHNVQGTGKKHKFELQAFGYSIYQRV